MSIPKQYRGLAVFTVVLSLSIIPAWPASNGAAGLPNFHRVNDHVFRGAQPSAEGWPSLAQLGIKTVIDLRRPDEHSTTEEARAVSAAGMSYVNVPMKGVVAPTDDQVSKVLKLLDSQQPVFVHCQRGADRTGAVIACYRIAHDRWDPKRALQEAKSFGMAWTQMGLKHYVLSFRPVAQSAALEISSADK
jgi:uncharacterized protein (TIGR01244 family)